MRRKRNSGGYRVDMIICCNSVTAGPGVPQPLYRQPKILLSAYSTCYALAPANCRSRRQLYASSPLVFLICRPASYIDEHILCNPASATTGAMAFVRPRPCDTIWDPSLHCTPYKPAGELLTCRHCAAGAFKGDEETL